jgi:hypothetical protein
MTSLIKSYLPYPVIDRIGEMDVLMMSPDDESDKELPPYDRIGVIEMY